MGRRGVSLRVGIHLRRRRSFSKASFKQTSVAFKEGASRLSPFSTQKKPTKRPAKWSMLKQPSEIFFGTGASQARRKKSSPTAERHFFHLKPSASVSSNDIRDHRTLPKDRRRYSLIAADAGRAWRSGRQHCFQPTLGEITSPNPSNAFCNVN